MGYLVNITDRAQLDLDEIYSAIKGEHSATAFRWFNRLERALLTLEQNPERCPITSESAELRHLLVGKKANVYRVIYRIAERQRQVDILHIRHGARRGFKNVDLA